MRFYDISMTIEPTMTVYKNKDSKRPRFLQSASFDQQGVYETDLHLNLHTGTHVDFPLHTIPGGSTSSQERLEDFYGSCKVLDLTHLVDHISREDLEKYAIEKGDFILFKTRNSFVEPFDYDFVYLDKSGAEYLRDKEVRGVGIDTLGIERNQANHPTHDLLLGNGILILEGLRLALVEPNEYTLTAFPIKIKDVEASLVRAILIEKE